MERRSWTEVSPLGDVLVRAVALRPDRDALVLPDVRVTYAELYERALTVARGLIVLGVRRGDKVGVLCHNGIEIAEGIFGCALVGVVCVPINARHRTNELDYIIAQGELRALLTMGSAPSTYEDFPDLLADSLGGLDDACDPTDLALPGHPWLKGIVALSGAATHNLLDRKRFEELAKMIDESAIHLQRRRVRLRDPTLILYTSGTTAYPKGCVHSHEAVTRGSVHRARNCYGGDVTWGAGPLFHVACLSPFVGSVGNAGTYVTDSYFEPGRAIRLLVEENVSVAFPWFPALIQPILDHADFDPDKLRALRSILVIGPRPLIDRVQAAFPQAEMLAACGMTETFGIYALSTSDETLAERAEAQGKAVDGVEIRIVDIVTGEDAPDGQVGEVLVRGHCLMTEYYRDAAKTAETFDEDGWLHTGDLYSRTPDGRIVFHGRMKDMLKVGGENVATIEVEALLCSHPAVRIASVVGRPDPRLDEVPVAFVEVYRGQSVTGQELIEFCSGKISRYKIPVNVRFLEEGQWPMSTTKIDKRGLRVMLE